MTTHSCRTLRPILNRLVDRRLSSSLTKRTGKTTRSVSPVLQTLEGRELLSLSGVAPNAGYPFTAIVELQMTFPDHKTYVGTGTMVDSFHVLTAGHVVYSYADGGFASRIIATPELYGTYRPFGTASMTYERTFTAFTSYNRTHPGQTAPGDYDIGMITLNRNIGNYTGWMAYGYDNNNADFTRGTIYDTAGYPAAGGYDGRHMEFSGGQIAGLSPNGSAIDYYQSSITTYAGQSGSPVWRANSGVVYGVVAGGNDTPNSLNFATRITQSIFNTLQSWRASDSKPSQFAASSAALGANLAGSPVMACAFNTASPTPSLPLPSDPMRTPRAIPSPVIVAPEIALPRLTVLTQVPGKARAALHHDLALDALQRHDFDLSWVA